MHQSMFSKLLKNLMTYKELSPNELATCLGLPESVIYEWMNSDTTSIPEQIYIFYLPLCGFSFTEVNLLLEAVGYKSDFSKKYFPQQLQDNLDIYLRRVYDRQSNLDLSIFQQGQERDFATVPLDKVYVPLRLTLQLPSADLAQNKEVTIFSSQILNFSAYSLISRNLTILGDAGSGKTTILRQMIIELTRSWLEDSSQHVSDNEDIVSSRGMLLPLLIPLRYYDSYCRSTKTPISRYSFFEFLPTYFRNHYDIDLPDNFYRQLIDTECCLLAFDGFDEVFDIVSRSQIVDLIRDLADSPDTGHNMIILSSRVAAYGGPTQLGGKFQTLWVQNMNVAEREIQVNRWIKATAPFTQRSLSADDILSRMPTGSTLDQLAVTPMIVTTLCVVYFYDYELPEQRAQLYRRCIDIILHEKLRPDEMGKKLAYRGGSPSLKRKLLARLAFIMHFKGKDSVDRETATRGIAGGFKSLENSKRLSQARNFLDTISERGTLLQERNGQFSFGRQHRTFQEFLAGYYLILGIDSEERRKLLNKLILDDRWREPIRLAIGTTVLENTRTCEEFIDELLKLADIPNSTLAVKLAGYSLAAEGLWDIGNDGREHIELNRQQRIINGLTDILFSKDVTNNKSSLIKERIFAARYLGLLGDPRTEVIRLPPSLTPWLSGPFKYSETKEEREVSPFCAAVYLITNAQFEQFIEADGYNRVEWWDEQGWRLRNERGWSKPRFWYDTNFGNPNHPVVGINWYEARAFCRWLSRVYEGEYRLPTEEEWERLARGQYGRKYPWGNDWQEDAANIGKDFIGWTTTVGVFLDGVSPTGAYDCAGNVWEWCSDSYSIGKFVVKGGSWSDHQNYAHCSVRLGIHGTARYYNVGMRVVFNNKQGK